MLIAHRNGMVVRKPLPYDAEVAWIESTGTQYIDTGLKANETMAVQTRVAWMELGYDKAAFESDNGSTFSGGYGLQVTSSGACFRFVRGNQYKDYYISGRVVSDRFYNITVNPAGFDVDGTFLAITDTAAFTATGNLPLFAWRRGENIASYKKVKLGPTKIYYGSTLVRDFVPVRFTDDLGQQDGAMYDRVTKSLFTNQGTGYFTLGPDKKTTSDYVQDGLVVMWDGIENAGPGVHSDSTLDFKDLVTGSSCGVGYEYGWSTNTPETPAFTVVADGVRSNDAVIGRSVGIGIPYPVSGWTWNYTIEYVRKVHSFAPTAGYNPGVVNSYPSATSVGMLMCQTGNHHIYLLYGGMTDTGLIESLGGCSVTSWGDNTDGREVIVHGVGNFTSGRGQFGVNTNTHICLSSSFCDATLCHLRVYSRALTAAEIAANRAVDEARFYLPTA